MNRRSFFARFLGAACIALAERVVPAALVKADELTMRVICSKTWVENGIGYHVRYFALVPR